MSRHKYFEDIENKSFEHPSKWGNLINDTRQKRHKEIFRI